MPSSSLHKCLTFTTAIATLFAGGCQPNVPSAPKTVAVSAHSRGEEEHSHNHAGGGHSHGPNSHQHPPDDLSHAEEDQFLELSEKARHSLGIQLAELVRSDYARSLRVPGKVVAIPGVTGLDVTAKVSGQVSKIFALEGQAVRPGSPLFEVRLMHEDAITAQIELLDALAKLEVVNAELKRLEDLQEKSEGTVAGIRIVQQKNERGHLQHTIASRRQLLVLLGIPSEDVAGFVERHRHQHHDMNGGSSSEPELPPLLDSVVIHAPQPVRDDAASGALYVVEKLQARVGQHVELASTLCRLGDYSNLHIEATAFEQDLGILRRAINNSWQAAVKVELRDTVAGRDDLSILYIAPEIDSESRAARFYLALSNELLSPAPTTEDHPFVDWKYRPGQRVEVHVPIEEFRSQLVLPADAIARDGVHQYVFVVDDEHAHQQEVAIQYRDEDVAVLAESEQALEGKTIVVSGAYQLKLALLNRSSEPVPHGHKH